MNSLLAKLSDEELATETATGRNTGIYILGHLTAVSDGLFTSLGLGDRLYPGLDEVFLRNPEKSALEKPSLSELKEYWNKINAVLAESISHITPDEWFEKHATVSAEDFAKEPHRNKLNIIINRTNHISYHLGQLVYLINK
jgi:hypothetical protein